MNYDDAVKMLQQYNGGCIDKAIVEMEISEHKITGKRIGRGGRKAAYLANVCGEDICILLPRKGGWISALREAENTAKLKNLGLITNDCCIITPVKLNGETLPAIITKPYLSHSFQIFDIKNPTEDLDSFINMNSVNEENFLNLIHDMLNDVKILSKNNIGLGSDSYNTALVNGKMRLYLSDLPENMTAESIDVADSIKKQLVHFLPLSAGRQRRVILLSNPSGQHKKAKMK